MPQNNTLKLTLAGDLCLRDLSGQFSKEELQRLFQAVRPVLDDADVRLVNLEHPLIEQGEPSKKSGVNLKGQPGDIAFLQEGRFDCAILANNHMGDFGPSGVLRTLSLLEEQGIGYCGSGRNLADSYKPWFVERNQVSLAVLAVAENEFGGAGDDTPGMAALQLGRLLDAIEAARQKARFVLVVVHGGHEHNPVPSPGVVERYRLICRSGADAVIGMHPHCPQGFEIYRGCPIIYSTGNFLFHNSHIDDACSSWYYGYLPQLTFSPDTGVSLAVTPYRFTPDCRSITPFSGAEKQAMLAYLAEISRPLQDPRQLADCFKGWCMITGPAHLRLLQFQPAFLEDPAFAEKYELLVMRNLLTCEAHHELLATLLRMIEKRELDFGRQMAEKIKEMQRMPV